MRAALFATLAVGMGALLFVIPGVNVIALIVVMLPLWMIDNLGVIDMGRELNGFFIPNTAGFVLAGVMFWLLWFIVLRAFLLRRRS